MARGEAKDLGGVSKLSCCSASRSPDERQNKLGRRVVLEGDVTTPVRAVVADLDGTLLSSSGEISPQACRVLKTLYTRGILIVLATARPLAVVDKISRYLPFAIPIVCSNGGMIHDGVRGVTRVRPLRRPVVAEILLHIREHFSDAAIAIDGVSDRVADPDWAALRGSMTVRTAIWPISADSLPRSRALSLMVIRAWSSYADVPNLWNASVTSSDYGMVEFSARSATKLSAVEWICRREGIVLSQVVAFGDMPNDVALLEAVGVGVAMSNGHPDVLSRIQNRALSNDDDGVAVYLEMMLAGGYFDSRGRLPM